MKNCILLLCLLLMNSVSIAQTLDKYKSLIDQEEKTIEIYMFQYTTADLSDEQKEELVSIYKDEFKLIASQTKNRSPEFLEDLQNKSMDLQDRKNEVLTLDQLDKVKIYTKQLAKVIKANRQFMDKNQEKISGFTEKVDQNCITEMQSILQKHRFKLDELMSKKDREELSKMKSDRKELSKEMKKLTYVPYKKELNKPANFKRLKNEQKVITKSLKNLALKYSPEITMLMDEIKPQLDEAYSKVWDKYKVIYKEAPLRKFNEEYFWSGHIPMYGLYNRFYTPEHHLKFMLLESEHQLDIATEISLHLAKSFPNPAITTQTLEFNTQQEGHVTIEIIDQKGAVIKTILNETRVAGQHQIQVDISDLQNGVFYYRIMDTIGSSSTKFLKKGE